MKKFTILCLLSLISIIILAQTPGNFSFQAIVRNESEGIIINQNISCRFSIIKGTLPGAIVYSEKHSTTTNQFGLITLSIGNGTEKTGDISLIDFGIDEYFMKVEIDPSGGTTYNDMGTTQLLSVPYSLHSKTSENISIQNQNAGDILVYNGSKWIALSKGVDGQILTMSAGMPVWQNQQTTSILGAIVNTSLATNIGSLSVTLNGNVNANNLPTTVSFEYGKTTSYGLTITASQSPLSGLANTPVSADLSNLKTGTTYHFRVKAVNSLGTSYGNDLSFTTDLTGFTTAALVDSSVTDMYKSAQLGYYNGITQRGYPFGAASIEQGDCRGEDAVNLQAFYQFTYEGTYSPTTMNNVYMWISTYRLINRCNIVIDSVKIAANNGIITAQKALINEGEARFLRALAYHELLIHFARPYKFTVDASHPGVTIHDLLTSTQIPDILVLGSGRSSVADVYSKILSDLDFAETNLPKKSDLSGNLKIARATVGAAIALKTRVYLHMENWSNVISETQKLMAYTGADGYALTSDPDGPFLNNFSNTESIFSMEHTATSNPGVNGALPAMYNGRSRALVSLSPIIWRNPSWLSDDKRRGPTMTYTSNGIIFTDKYKDITLFTDASPIIRYAEVLLNCAEAYARRNTAGDITLGLNYLNMVRNRSLFNISTQAYTGAGFADNVALLNGILVERRIEFAMEGRRWADLHRLQLDIPDKVANSNPPAAAFTLGTPYSGPYGILLVPYSNFKFLWPIPQREIDVNPTYSTLQNPGW